MISPVLFAVYVNNLLLKVQQSKLGCYINHVPMSIFMFADDLALVASSITHLCKMMEICHDELAELDMKLNINKTQCIGFGKTFSKAQQHFSVNGIDIHWSNTVTYLGVSLKSGNKLHIDSKNRRTKFYQSFNSIFSKASKSGETVLQSLLKSYCLPCLYYGLESFDMTRAETDKLNVPIMRAFNKIFHVFDKNCVQLCMFYCGVLPPSLELIYRKFKFLCKAQHIDNLNLLTCLPLNMLCLNGFINGFVNDANLSFRKLREKLTHLFYLDITNGS